MEGGDIMGERGEGSIANKRDGRKYKFSVVSLFSVLFPFRNVRVTLTSAEERLCQKNKYDIFILLTHTYLCLYVYKTHVTYRIVRRRINTVN